MTTVTKLHHRTVDVLNEEGINMADTRTAGSLTFRFRRRIPVTLAAFALSVATALSACSSAGSSGPSTSGVMPDTKLASDGVKEGPEAIADFYGAKLPANAKPGDVIWARPRSDAPTGSRGYTIMYVSTSVHGGLVPVSGQLYVPDTLKPGIVMYAHGSVGNGDDCAPSRQPIMGSSDYRNSAVKQILADGHATVLSDYEGLGTPGMVPYLNGKSQAENSLDAVRAARHMLGDAVGNELVIFGLSQGGQTVMHTAHIAGTYAPDLDLLGAYGMGPSAKYYDMLKYELTDPPQKPDFSDAFYAISGLVGINVGKDLPLRDVLTPDGFELLPVVLTGSCWEGATLAAQKKPGSLARMDDLQPGTPWGDMLIANDDFMPIPASVPITIGQGGADASVHPTLTHQLRDELCKSGSIVDYHEYPGEPHAVPSAWPYIGQWAADRFAGKAPANTCNT